MIAKYDIAIIGSGFAGSLMAMIARRQGRSVILLERGRHPRFAIGESSTPLANLVLEQLAERYQLPAVRALSKWGQWQRSYPAIGCGLKRGFSFYHHKFDQPFIADLDKRTNELLVAASPYDEIADTHWYRPDFDNFLVGEAQSLGADYHDQTTVTLVSENKNGVTLHAARSGRTEEIRARLLIDASGPRGFLHRALQLSERPFTDLPKTQALYAHFSDVERWASQHQDPLDLPYPPDDAAVHHVFDGGWIWILRFSNGVTSAGVAAYDRLAKELSLQEGAAAWQRLLNQLPSVHNLFCRAKAITPFVHLPQLSFRTSQPMTKSCVMLPSAAGIVDPLLSTGIALTLLGIERLASIIEEHWESEDLAIHLAELNTRTHSELDATARLIAALYANMHDPEVFSALTLLYFAAASFSESARRVGRSDLARSFLLHDEPSFGPALITCCRDALQNKTLEQRAALLANIRHTIEPFDVAGLRHSDRRNWYPALAEDFLESSHKVGTSRESALQALIKAGFSPQ